MKNKQTFITAAQDGDIDTVKHLLATDKTLATQINAPWFSFNAPAIVFAAASGNRELIEVLLDAGANIDIKSSWWAGGTSVLHHAAGSMLSYDKELAEYLIERGATIDAHAAAGLDMSEKLAELIRENPEVVNAPGSDGMSPLHFAATPRIAELLLAHGANINLRDRDHNGTPAQWTMRRRPEVCRYLLEQGAEADIVRYCVMGDVEQAKMEFQKNPELLKLRINVKSPKGYIIPTLKSPDLDGEQTDEVPGGHVYAYQVGPTMPLLEVALQSKQSTIVDLLIDAGYEINLRDWYVLVGQGPKRFDTLVKGFLAKGWDINTRQKHRHGMWAPLHWVGQRGLTAGVVCLLENGADPNITDDKGRTPMHIIAQKGVGKNQVQALIKYGGDINIRDADGKTPLDYAQKAKKKSVKNFLTEYANQVGKNI
ncbi:MAG: ankyrin repeat domain-containing protein [Candidatus Poribacteria bacterium]|nr:ankyrin repeat domain-containing protein [Candidatus Poribacteria bacterium]